MTPPTTPPDSEDGEPPSIWTTTRPSNPVPQGTWETTRTRLCGDANYTFSMPEDIGGETLEMRPPTNLETNNIDGDSADLSWDSGGDDASLISGYNVEYRINASGNSFGNRTTVTGTSTQITGLDANTPYEWRVRTLSAVPGYSSSGWASSTFSTTARARLPAPSLPITPTTNIEYNEATANWNPVIHNDLDGFLVEWRSVGAGSWLSASISATSTSYSITNLLSNSNYEWRVRSVASSGSSTDDSNPTDSQQFTTAMQTVTCPSASFYISSASTPSRPSDTTACGTPSGWQTSDPGQGDVSVWRTNRSEASGGINTFTDPVIVHEAMCHDATFYIEQDDEPDAPGSTAECSTPLGWTDTDPGRGTVNVWQTMRTAGAPNTFSEPTLLWSAFCPDASFWFRSSSPTIVPSTPSSTMFNDCSTPSGGWSDVDPGPGNLIVYVTNRSYAEPSDMNVFSTPTVEHGPIFCFGMARNLDEDNIRDESADVSWDPPSVATGLGDYLISWSLNVSGAPVSAANTSSTSHTISSLSASTEYRWRITTNSSPMFSCPISTTPWKTFTTTSGTSGCSDLCGVATFYIVQTETPSTPASSLSCTTPTGWTTTNPGQGNVTVWSTSRTQNQTTCINSFSNPVVAHAADNSCSGDPTVFYQATATEPSTPSNTESCDAPSGWSLSAPCPSSVQVWQTTRSFLATQNENTFSAVSQFECPSEGCNPVCPTRAYYCEQDANPGTPSSTTNCGGPGGCWDTVYPEEDDTIIWRTTRTQDSNCRNNFTAPTEVYTPTTGCNNPCGTTNFYQHSASEPSVPASSLSCSTPSGWQASDPGQSSVPTWVTTRSQGDDTCINSFSSVSQVCYGSCGDETFYRGAGISAIDAHRAVVQYADRMAGR